MIETAVTALDKAYDLVRQADGASQLRELADTDSLTGCANRRALDRRLREELDRARRGGQTITIVLLDIDDFKRINDTYGHPIGDRVLKELAGVLKKELRTIDFLARYGGEEFVVILPQTGRHRRATVHRPHPAPRAAPQLRRHRQADPRHRQRRHRLVPRRPGRRRRGAAAAGGRESVQGEAGGRNRYRD